MANTASTTIRTILRKVFMIPEKPSTPGKVAARRQFFIKNPA
jgi:hypothetical protein